MSSGFDMVNNGWGKVIFSEGVEVFGYPIMKPSFSFTNVKTITIPAICSEIIMDCFEQLMRKKDFLHQVFWKMILRLTQK